MLAQQRITALHSLAGLALLATLGAPLPTQNLESPELETFQIDAQVQDLGAFADLLETWEKAPFEVLTLDLGPKSGANGERLLKVSLRSPDRTALVLGSKDAKGVRFTTVRSLPPETGPVPFAPPVKNPATGRYDLNFTQLDFGSDAVKGKIAVRPELFGLDGQEVSIEGYMIPLQWEDDQVTEMMLVAHMAECCFGGAPEYDEWIHVHAPKGKPIKYLPYEPIRIQGKLELPSLHPNKQDPDFDVAYRLIDATD